MNTLSKDAEQLSRFIRAHPKLVVLTGAGVSLDSGIPTYRDDGGKWLPQAPIQERDFLNDPFTRRRYWSRSWYGWPIVRDAAPNQCHTALATLESSGYIELLITQNVDGLHQKAGSRAVTDLHGRVDSVRCLACDTQLDRGTVQQQLGQSNAWPPQPLAPARPDGDMDIPDEVIAGVTLPRCPACSGDLRPDVVFFGGSVPAERVQRCQLALEQADALLVVGSSLMVFSGFRFCRRAQQLGKPIAIVNAGVTRADDLAHTRLHCPAGPLLTETLLAL